MSYHFDVAIIGSVPLIHDFDDVDPTLAARWVFTDGPARLRHYLLSIGD
jgi:hypothetical protein